MALTLRMSDESEWLVTSNNSIGASQIQSTSPIKLGVLGSGKSAGLMLDSKHGLAFNEQSSLSYDLVLVIGLLD